jgi:glucose/arabinose dehydrogenase
MYYNYVIPLMVIFILNFGMIYSYGELETEKSQNTFAPKLKNENFTIELVTAGLNFPTKMTFLDENNILVGQKYDGKVILIKNFEIVSTSVLDLHVDGFLERGLVGLESANFHNKKYVFVYYTESTKEEDTFDESKQNNNGNKLVRYEWNGKTLVNPISILNPDYKSDVMHVGGATAILDDSIFLIVGDNLTSSSLTNRAQFSISLLKQNCIDNFQGSLCLDLISNFLWMTFKGDPADSIVKDNGVIFRINFDGSEVNSNPFSKPQLLKYYSYGIRNSYGLAIDPVTKSLWDTENGPEKFDEINLVFPGMNSGWQLTVGPDNKTEFTDHDKLVIFEGSKYSDPEFSWEFTVAPTAIEFLKSKHYGVDLENDVFVGDVHGRLYHFELNEKRDGFVFEDSGLKDLVVENEQEMQEIIFGRNLGIITDIKTGPDGYLYILSMVKTDIPSWPLWAINERNQDVTEKAEMMGVIFRIVPQN